MISKAMKVILNVLLAVFVTTCLVLIVSCETPSGPGQLAPEYATPQGDEVPVSCPPERAWSFPDPTEVAEQLQRAREHPEDYPLPGAAYLTPPPSWDEVPGGTIAALLPPDPFSGRLNGCGLSPNSEDGAPFTGFFANEAELDRLGRLCGCDTTDATHDISRGYFSLRVDLYLTTTGAREGFRMESRSIRRAYELDIDDIYQARLANLGDERIIRQAITYVEQNGQESQSKSQQALLVRWHNIVARIELSPYHPTEMLLDYAEQLGRNIEAAAKNATPTPQ